MSCSVVVLVGDNVDPGELILSVLGAPSLEARIAGAIGTSATVTLVSWPVSSKPLDVTATLQVTSQEPGLDHLLRKFGAKTLRDTLHRTAIGRLLNSVGPLDTARVFLRRVRRSPEVVRAIEAADYVIAMDIASVRTAWKSLQRGESQAGLFGLLGSLRWLEAASALGKGPADRTDLSPEAS